MTDASHDSMTEADKRRGRRRLLTVLGLGAAAAYVAPTLLTLGQAQAAHEPRVLRHRHARHSWSRYTRPSFTRPSFTGPSFTGPSFTGPSFSHPYHDDHHHRHRHRGDDRFTYQRRFRRTLRG